ncbi:MAG: TolC family protein, partial [Elusimicrobiota bacterium]|nr:TolC family protein [Elusimicrobiota bacterium]
MKKILCFCLLFLAADLFAVQKISLADCEKAALKNSNALKAAAADFLSAQKAAQSFKTSLYPSLMLEANLRYIAEIPEFNGIKMGDNLNYSAGFALYWTLFDFAARSRNYESLSETANSQYALLQARRESILLDIRNAYFSLIGALLTLDLTQAQLELSLKQNSDIKSAFQYGAKSRLDAVLSDADVLRKQKQLKQIQIAVIESAARLNELTGGIIEGDLSEIPLKNKSSEIVELESTESLLKRYNSFLDLSFDEDSPQIKSLDFLSKTYFLLSQAQISSSYPQIAMSAKTSFDYPNGAALETIHQNAASLSLNAPIYQFSKSANAAAQNLAKSKSYEEQKEGMKIHLKTLFEASKIKARLLLSQKPINRDITAQIKTAAELMYKSYLSGN